MESTEEEEVNTMSKTNEIWFFKGTIEELNHLTKGFENIKSISLVKSHKEGNILKRLFSKQDNYTLAIAEES